MWITTRQKVGLPAIITTYMELGKGYLSYTLAMITVLGGCTGYLMGTIDASVALTMIWAGLAVFGLRRAIG